MKVAFFMTTILEQGGGLEKYLIETAVGLSQRDSVDVNIITMDDKITIRLNKLLSLYYFKKHNVTLPEIHNESKRSVLGKLGRIKYHKCSRFSELKRLLGKYDVIYSKNELIEAFIFKFVLKYKRLPPVVFGCHTPIYYPTSKSLSSKLHNFFYLGFLYKWLADGVLAFHVTNASDKILLSDIFPKRKIFMIYNPFDLSRFEENISRYTFDFKFDSEKVNILWVARLTEQKGVKSLIRIIDEINRRGLENRLVFNVIGSGPLDNEIKALDEKWQNVNWFGYIEYRYLPSIYKRNDIFISTSQWESLPYNVLEAQACGLPAISYDIPGPREIIRDSVSGFLVSNERDFCDRIEEVSKRRKFFDSDTIASRINSMFNPEEIYPKIHSMLSSVSSDDSSL